MRISSILFASLLASSLALPLGLGGCSDNHPADAEPFLTLQACFDEHTSGGEHLPIQEAIVVCCLDHPIAGVAAPTCLDTQAACVVHVRAALTASTLDADIDAACTTYIAEKNK